MRRFGISLMVLATLILSPAVAQQNAPPPQVQPQIEAPTAYTARKLEEFRARLEALKAQRANQPRQAFDATATVDSLMRQLDDEGQRDLVVTVDGLEAIFSPVTTFEPVHQNFLFDAPRPSILTPFSNLSQPRGLVRQSPGAVLLAIDENTSTAFGLPLDLSLKAEGQIGVMIPRGSCCVRQSADRDASGERICLETAEIFEQQVIDVDLRDTVGTDVGTEIVYQGFSGDPRADRFRANGPGLVSVGYRAPLGSRSGIVQCVSGERFSTSIDRGDAVERLVSGTGVEFVHFGLPALDVAQIGPAPNLDFFVAGRARDGALDVAAPVLPRPIASYRMGEGIQFDGMIRFDMRRGLAVDVAGVGPFLPQADGVLALTQGARPGAADVTWSLNGAFDVTHTLRLNEISVNIDTIGPRNTVLDGRDYTVEMAIEGPTDIAGGPFDIAWEGNVVWADPNGDLIVEPGLTRLVNTFRPGTNRRPVVEIALTGPSGEIARFNGGYIVGGSAIVGLDLVAALDQTLGTIATGASTKVDTFFPSIAPATPARVATNLRLLTATGTRETLIQARSGRAGRVAGFPASLAASNDESMLTLVSRNANADALFEVTPRIGVAEITSSLFSNSVLAEDLTGGGTSLGAPPILVTSNSLRLEREAEGHRLIVRGPADMADYRARWTLGNGGSRSTTFTADEVEGGGASSAVETAERLSRVEIVRGDQVHATVLGIMATQPARIEILPFRQAVEIVDKETVVDFGALAGSEQFCREQLALQAEAGQDLGGRSVNAICAERAEADKQAVRERRDQQQQTNRFLEQLDRQGKALVELAGQMQIAAQVQGAPPASQGTVECVWSIIGGQEPLAVAQAASPLVRTAEGDFCFNTVTGVREGFSPGAEIRVELRLRDGHAARLRDAN